MLSLPLECSYCYHQLRDENVNLICLLGVMNMNIGDGIIFIGENTGSTQVHGK